MAASVIALAEESSLDVSIPYLETAEAWTQLASDIEWAAQKTTLGHALVGASAARQLGRVT